jgi:hypothetical protein
MISEITKHFDYVLIIVAAIILYRMLGEPLAFKV